MIVSFFLIIYLGMALYDADYTHKQIERLSPLVELNVAIRKLCIRFGARKGAYLGVLGPTVVLGVIGYMFPYVLAFLLGMRTTLFAFQYHARHK